MSDLDKLLIQQRKLKARIDKVRARDSAQKRKDDTRRKILVGAMVLDDVDLGVVDKEKFLKKMDKRLTRKNDRKLFGLPNLGEEASDNV